MTPNTTNGPNRRIPTWAVGLHNSLAKDRPAVVTRADIGAYLAEVDSDRDIDATVKQLQRLGWLVPVHIKGAWAYLPPGEVEITDRYIDLRAWRARDPDAVFALAGEAAAWHLGYLDREFSGPLAIWLPTEIRTPFGLRKLVSEVKLGWGAGEIEQLLPSSLLLHQRHLDLTKWAGGIPSFGPEALVVQLSARVKSFRSWADLIPHLEELASDIDTERLSILLSGKSQSAWQRAGYLLDRGGRHDDGLRLLNGRTRPRMADVVFGDGEHAVWVSQFQIVDRLIAPLQRDLGTACQACQAVRRTERRASIRGDGPPSAGSEPVREDAGGVRGGSGTGSAQGIGAHIVGGK